MDKKPIGILIIEDNEGDVILIKEAFQDSKIVNKINCVDNGYDALDYLNKIGKYANVNTPDLILLDLNLPGKTGHEVLFEIKTNDQIKNIPVIILTSSDNEQDIYESYQNYANCYVQKPIDFKDFFRAIKSIESFWFEIVKL